jgi:hypothetical protein
MTAISETAPQAIAYDSLNSTLAETGWRLELVSDEQGREKILYFPLTETEFLHPLVKKFFSKNVCHCHARKN